MTQIELIADLMGRDLHILNMTLADFSDADMLVRPCPGANHAAWQLGHLIGAEAGMLAGFKAPVPALPPEFEGKFTKETSGKDDASFFPKKAVMMDQLAKTHAAAVAWVKTLKPSDLDQPSPERIASFAPTLGHLLALTGNHIMMHMGQFQVIRRKLGKPVLF